MTSEDSNFNFRVDVHMGLTPFFPSTCVHRSLAPPPPGGRHKWMALSGCFKRPYYL